MGWGGQLGLGCFSHNEKAPATHLVEDFITTIASLDILETKKSRSSGRNC